MTWRTRLLIFLAIVSTTHSKEKTKKALIIAVNEIKPEQSDAIISDLTIKDQSTSSSQNDERSHTTNILERNTIDKELDYILVRPEDLKALKELQNYTIETPTLLRYPETSSDESYEASRYRPLSQEPEPYSHSAKEEYRNTPSAKSKSLVIKYPSRPAPPLETYSGGRGNIEEPINYDSHYLQKDYQTYDSPNISPYKELISYDTPNTLTISGAYGPSYGPSKPTTSSTYESSKPNSYSGTSSYSLPGNSYESSKPSSYHGYSTYKTLKPGAYSIPSYYGGTKPSSYSSPYTYSAPSYETSNPSSYSGPSTYQSPNPSSYSGPSTYESSKPSSYSGPSAYDSSKPGGYSGPSTYEDSKPSSYSGPSTYQSSNPSSYSGPSTYQSSKPSSYSGPSAYESSKPDSYSGPSTYEDSKPSSYSVPSTYDSPKPISYSGPSTHESPKPNSYSGPSMYESPKPSSYSGPSTYQSPSPSSYSGPSPYESSKPSSYTGTSTYENSRPNTYSDPSNYGSSRPDIYKETSSYSGTDNSHSNSKPSSNLTTSSYSAPGSSYSSITPPGYSGPSSYYRPSSPHYDSSDENTYQNSEKYTSSPENYNRPHKTYSYDHNSPKDEMEYERSPNYTPIIRYGKRYYNTPSVKHVLYDDLPSYKNPPPKNMYEPPHLDYNDKSPNDSPKSTDSSTSKPTSHDTYHRDSPAKEYYISPLSYEKDRKHHSYHSSNPSYGKKIRDVLISPVTYKPRSPYYSNRNIESYRSSLLRSKVPYDTLKTSYQSLYGPSSYEEPIKSSIYRYPSSKVTYDLPSYSDHRPRSALSDLKDSVRSKYEYSTYSKPNTESEYHSGYHSPPSITDDNKYESRPSNFKEPSHNLKSISTSNYDDPSVFNTQSNLGYGSRYPTSYRQTNQKDSKSHLTSKFTLEDVKSPASLHHYHKKPKSDSTESHYPYEYDSSEIEDTHSAKKNYSPVRPAPLHDQLEQPRYPPLPRYSKKSKDNKYYDTEDDRSKESGENYTPQSNHPDSYSDYSRDPYKSQHLQGKVESHYSTSSENPYYSDQSSEEADDEPTVYTKTITHTKPYKGSSTEHSYNSENPDKNPHKPSMYDYERINTYSSKGKDFVISQPQYSRPVYKQSEMSPAQNVHSYAYKNEKKPSVNTSLPISYSSLSGVYPPKRVEGVVYRSRQYYPNVKTYRKYKGYLPYKPYYPRSNSAHDYKSVSSEIREKNVTRDAPVYNLPRKTSKSKNHKKHITHSSLESKDEYDDTNEDSNPAAIPGEPGKDYPVLKEIPYNSFSCDNKIPGFYADVENRCQVYFQCNEEGRLQSFLCPNGTIFNQATFVCEWWHNVDCSKSERYFAKNNELYKVPSSPKSKSRTKSNYERSHSEIRGRENYPSYAIDDEKSHPTDNVRKLRSKVSYAPHPQYS